MLDPDGFVLVFVDALIGENNPHGIPLWLLLLLLLFHARHLAVPFASFPGFRIYRTASIRSIARRAGSAISGETVTLGSIRERARCTFTRPVFFMLTQTAFSERG